MVNSTTAFHNIVDWQKWTRYRMMIRGNVLMMFSSEKKTTDTVINHIVFVLHRRAHLSFSSCLWRLLAIFTVWQEQRNSEVKYTIFRFLILDSDVGPPVPVGTSGDEIPLSLAVAGDSLRSSPCHSHVL